MTPGDKNDSRGQKRLQGTKMTLGDKIDWRGHGEGERFVSTVVILKGVCTSKLYLAVFGVPACAIIREAQSIVRLVFGEGAMLKERQREESISIFCLSQWESR